ncbi:MAG: sigma-54 interaction domain-containing protein, partial [Eubacterium sp.]
RELNRVADAVPVMEERISMVDVVSALRDIHEDKRKPVYLVLHQDYAEGMEALQEITDFELKIRSYNTLKELKAQIQSIPEKNIIVLTSGVAKDVSERDDLDFIGLWNRPYTIRESVRAAKNILRQSRDKLQRVNVLDSVYNNISEGILIFDETYRIREMNRRAEKFLGISMDEAVGTDIYKVISEMPARRRSGTCNIDSPRTFLGKKGRGRNAVQLTYSVYPFTFNQEEQRFLLTIQDVSRVQEEERSIRLQLAKKGFTAEHTFKDIQTADPEMKHVVENAELVSPYNGAVLIYGESGTGKELFAQSIHNASDRANGPFVAVNCAALTESLLESELFGYVGGSFTGARKEGKSGLFELAHQGTIFLDEINSMPVSLQTKILRVIEEQQVMRIGSDSVTPIDVRIISATNGDLKRDVQEGKFRRDLYYRLNTFQISIPPVRRRPDDILPLFQYYLDLYDKGHHAAEITPEFRDELLHYSWLGNVREIKSVALRYCAYNGDNSNGSILPREEVSRDKGNEEREYPGNAGRSEKPEVQKERAESAPPDPALLVNQNKKIDLKELTGTIERIVIQQLEDQGMSKSDIAKVLGISRQSLYKKMK